jgi:hypothetical protein
MKTHQQHSSTLAVKNSSKKAISPSFILLVCILNFFMLKASATIPENVKLSQDFTVSEKKSSSDFILAEKGMVAPIVVSAFDHPGVIEVMKMLQKDMTAVTGIEPKLLLDAMPDKKQVVIVGTLGKSQLIDQLVGNNKINVNDIKGKWENTLIEVVENPFPNIERALVIVGSDKRGTIYGIFELSKKMGVSPWYWWSDVPIEKKTNLYVKAGSYNFGEPKVKYRGIFLNDEEPCLGRWAVENYGGFNHQFYEKVFELILRLKGNYIWPAMWWAGFNMDDPQNAQTADRLGIVMGTSHHEPMNRAHAEWKRNGKGAWNYETNSEALKKFWAEGIKRIGDSEVIVTLAMRGDGDEAMTESTNINLLQRIVNDQRTMIAEITGKPVEQTPQMWALYKEVQDYYDKGMRVPDDITLLLCDDNWGNIRKLPKPGTPARKGGYGIYYHFDYVGGPRNYKWVNTCPIPRIWEQMNMAYEHGVNQLWLVNVGDLKPMEYPISFFLDYAWNPQAIPSEKLPEYSKNWAGQQFGEKYAEEASTLIDTYLKYNSRRKPELIEPDTYSLINYREFEKVVTDYNDLLENARKLGKKLPKEYQDAFYQLVLHPIEACANLNELYFVTGKNRLYAEQSRIGANDLAKKAEQLFKKDADITEYYHTKLSGGKWNNMMSQTHIGYTYWQQPERNVMPAATIIQPRSEQAMGVAVEGSKNYRPNFQGDLVLPLFDCFNKQSYFIDVYNMGKKSFNYEMVAGQPWIKISETKGKVESERRVMVQIDWGKAPTGENCAPITITGSEGSTTTVQVPIRNIADDERKIMKGFIENNGVIAIEAEHFTKNMAGNMASWKVIPGMGRTLSAMHPVPVTAARQTPKNGSPSLEYDVYLWKAGEIKVNLILAPTLNIYNDEGLEIAVSLDNGDPIVLNMHGSFSFQDWEEAVRTNSRGLTANLNVSDVGNHTLKVWMVDPGVCLERIIVQTGTELTKSYLGAPESANLSAKR